MRRVLEEFGTPHQIVPVLFPPRLRQPDFLQINPLGLVPAFRDTDFQLTESVAICRCLVEKHAPTRLVVAASEAGHADCLESRRYGEATSTGSIGTLVRHTRVEPENRRVPQAIGDAQQTLRLRLKPPKRVLESRDFLAADRLTLADESTGCSTDPAIALGLAPPLSRCMHRLAQQPACQHAHELPAVSTDERR